MKRMCIITGNATYFRKKYNSFKMQFVYVEIKCIGNNTAISCKSKKTFKYCKILL